MFAGNRREISRASERAGFTIVANRNRRKGNRRNRDIFFGLPSIITSSNLLTHLKLIHSSSTRKKKGSTVATFES